MLDTLSTFTKMIDRFSGHFQRTRATEVYPNQSPLSCLDIYGAVINTQPDVVIEVGTSHGASTIAIAMALHDLGAPLSMFTTIDIHQGLWHGSTRTVQSDIFDAFDFSPIHTLEQDFATVNPEPLLYCKPEVLVFFDAHDQPNQPSISKILIDNWFPLMNNGTILFHDFTLVLPDPANFPGLPDNTSTATHFSGKQFAGFKEIDTVIPWLNDNKIALTILSDSLIKFEVKK